MNHKSKPSAHIPKTIPLNTDIHLSEMLTHNKSQNLPAVRKRRLMMKNKKSYQLPPASYFNSKTFIKHPNPSLSPKKKSGSKKMSSKLVEKYKDQKYKSNYSTQEPTMKSPVRNSSNKSKGLFSKLSKDFQLFANLRNSQEQKTYHHQ